MNELRSKEVGKPTAKWGVTFGLPRVARSHEIKDGLIDLDVDIAETNFKVEALRLNFDCMRVWDKGKGNLDSVDWAACASRSEWERPKVQPVG